MLEHYAEEDNTRYLQMRFFNILLSVRNSDRYGSLGSPVCWHNMDKEEVYEEVGRTLEVEGYMPMSSRIDRGKGDIS